MFWNKSNTKRIEELESELRKTRGDLAALKIDLELYVRKLKASKGFKSTQEELGDETKDPKDIKDSVLLKPDGSPIFPQTSKKR